jgi:hypothetical protein
MKVKDVFGSVRQRRFGLTEFAPVVSRLSEHVIEADDVPEAQVDALTRERVDSVGGVPKNSSAVWQISIEKIHNSP